MTGSVCLQCAAGSSIYKISEHCFSYATDEKTLRIINVCKTSLYKDNYKSYNLNHILTEHFLHVIYFVLYMVLQMKKSTKGWFCQIWFTSGYKFVPNMVK